MALCLGEISKIDKYFLPSAQDLQREIKGDATELKMILERLRTAIKADGESLKSVVDTVVSENIQEADSIEQSLLEKLQSQETMFDDYVSYLHETLTECYGYMSSSKLSIIIPKLSEKVPEIRPIPETAKPVTPVFTAGQYNKDDVAKLLGKMKVTNTKAEIRKIKAMETVPPSTSEEYGSKQNRQDSLTKSDVKPAMSVSFSFNEVREFNVPDVSNTCHMSLDKSDRLWASDLDGNLVQTDLQGNQLQEKQTDPQGNQIQEIEKDPQENHLPEIQPDQEGNQQQKIKTSGGYGYHTVTQEGELIFTDRNSRVIKKKTGGNKITKFIKTGSWAPISIHSSHINGDILVGMEYEGWFSKREVKVTRYSTTGKELQNIQWDNEGHKLYSSPLYITENINSDVCVSDSNKRAVVVVNQSGEHRFSYTGQGSEFEPHGICTDALGHILVCNGTLHSDGVHLLDQDGQFLSLLLTADCHPRGMCVDDEKNIYVGRYNNNTVTVYKYLQ
jgi:type II secretory pathway pseudopilin PulG